MVFLYFLKNIFYSVLYDKSDKLFAHFRILCFSKILMENEYFEEFCETGHFQSHLQYNFSRPRQNNSNKFLKVFH